MKTNPMIPATYKVITEADVEGKSTKVIGIFYGTPLQIAEYLTVNDIKYGYGFYLEAVQMDVKDLTAMNVKFVQNAIVDNIGRMKIIINDAAGDLKRVQLRNKALAKLSPEEIEALGL